MKTFAHVSNGIQFTVLGEEMLKEGFTPVLLYDLPYTNLAAYCGVVITNHVDEPFLYEHRGLLLDYLAQGGVVCSFAEPYLPWLPGGTVWQRSDIPLKDREIVVADAHHPIFAGVDPYDLNYKQGVRGFFSRGYFDMPEGAEPVIVDQEGRVIWYCDRVSTPGTLLVGAGGDLGMFVSSDNSTGAVISQLAAWIGAERERNEGRRVR